MNKTKILLFANLRDYVGSKSIDVEFPTKTTVAELKTLLVEKYPRLSLAKDSMMVAVNREYASDEQLIPPNAEIAFFPPVSGG